MYFFIGGALALAALIPAFMLALKFILDGREYSNADISDKASSIGMSLLCSIFIFLAWPLFLVVGALMLCYWKAESGIEKFYNRFMGNSKK